MEKFLSRLGLRTISESVSQRENAGGKGGRHAVIRRHQSMYIHPRATELLPPFNTANEVPTFNLHEVSGKSEVRPIVTLKRSKTTVGQFTTPTNTLHYRGSSTLQPPRTFRSNSVAKQMKLFDHNHNIYGTNKRKSHHYSNTSPNGGGGGYNMLDDICEFQVKIEIYLMIMGEERRVVIFFFTFLREEGSQPLLHLTKNTKRRRASSRKRKKTIISI